MPVENISLPQNISSFTDLGSYMNVATGGYWFWTLVLLASYITLFIILQRISTTARAAASTGFIIAIIAIFMYILQWISFRGLFISIIAAVFGIVALYLESK